MVGSLFFVMLYLSFSEHFPFIFCHFSPFFPIFRSFFVIFDHLSENIRHCLRCCAMIDDT